MNLVGSSVCLTVVSVLMVVLSQPGPSLVLLLMLVLQLFLVSFFVLSDLQLVKFMCGV